MSEDKAKYAKAVLDLLDEPDESVIVNVAGTDIMVMKPDSYRHLRLLMALESKAIDDLEYIVQMIRLCVPGNLSASQAIKLLEKDGYPKKDSKLLDTVSSFKGIFSDTDVNASFDAGKSGEANADFGEAGPSESD